MTNRMTPRRIVAASVLLGAVLASGCQAPERSEQSAPTPVRVEGATLSRPAETSTSATPTTAAPTTTTSTTTPVPVTIAPVTTMPAAVSTGLRDDRIAQALSAIHVDWQRLLPGWTMTFQASRAGYQGGTFPDDHRIEIYVRSGSTVDQLAHVIAHELGHAVDVTYFDDAGRATFQVLRGRASTAAWWVAAGTRDFSSGAGDWAESFSWLATGGLGEWKSELGPPPDATQLAAMADLIAARSGIRLGV